MQRLDRHPSSSSGYPRPASAQPQQRAQPQRPQRPRAAPVAEHEYDDEGAEDNAGSTMPTHGTTAKGLEGEGAFEACCPLLTQQLYIDRAYRHHAALSLQQRLQADCCWAQV